ncbi:MAG: Protease HtpX [Fimbriimonadaceae bacterium]|nr:Protease HtpX [Fimbriimonadaceae bacterium]
MMDVLFQALLHSLWQGPLVALLAIGASRLTTDPAIRHKVFGLGIALVLALVPISAIWAASSTASSPAWALAPGLQTGLVWAWAAGSLISLIRLVLRWSKPRRTTSGAQPAPKQIQKVADDLVRRFGLAPVFPVLLGPERLSPTVFGWLKPVILVPGALLTRLSPPEVEALIAHEIAHIARRDYLWLLMQSIAESVLFYNPAVWLLSGLMREERENACDDLAAQVLGSKLRVARALVELENLRLQPTWSPAGVGGCVTGRIRRQLGMPEVVQRAWRLWSLGLTILGGLAFYFSPSATPTALPTSGSAKMQSKVITIRMEAHPHDRLPAQPRMLILGSDGTDQVLEIIAL